MKKNLKKIAKDVIDLEIQALNKLKKSINISFEKAVNAIINCKSKIIVCGVGKSYLIASKVSSTMSSIGCASFSINANECSHGDLGSISRKDVLIIISNSGNTEELKPVLQYANRFKIKLIGITSRKNSFLYKELNSWFFSSCSTAFSRNRAAQSVKALPANRASRAS